MLQDVRLAIRMLAKDRWYTLVGVVALGLGIGLNATVFTCVNAVLLRGLPFPEPDRVVHLSGRHTVNGGTFPVSYSDYRDLRAQTTAFSDLAAYRQSSFTVTERGLPPERIGGATVTPNTFDLLRQPPLLGRAFVPGDDRPDAPPVVLIGYGTWHSRYGGDPSVLGRVLNVNGTPATVVGVMPEGMRFPNNAEIWRPLVPEANDLERRDARSLDVIGRLAPGSTREQAQTEVAGVAGRLQQEYAETNRTMTFAVMTANERFNGGQIRTVFLALFGAVGFVLLIACANVANLLLARSAGRAREVALRLALGATRGHIVRLLLVESVLLAGLGGLLGLSLAWVGVRMFDAAVADTGKPYWIVFSFDPIVFAYLAGICLVTGILFGLAPALQVSRTSMNEVLKEGGRGTAGTTRARRLASGMVIAELTLTLVLLVGAGLMIRSFLKLYSIDIGVDTRQMLTTSIELPAGKYPTPEERRLFFERLFDRVHAIPGVQAATFASSIPAAGAMQLRLDIEGRPLDAPDSAPRVSTVVVGPAYFETMGVAMQRGRALRAADGAEGADHVVVNARFATLFFPEEDPIGKRIRLRTEDTRAGYGPWCTIVGVSPTIRQGNPQNAEPDAVVYQPYALDARPFMNVITRARVEPESLAASVRSAVQAVDPDQPVFQIRTIDAFLAQTRWPYRVFGSMFAIFASVALVLSAVGLYAVTAYSVTQRTQEIGVRMALGARPAQVSWLILRRGLVQLVLGLGLGLGLAWPLARVLESLMVQIPSHDPVTFGGIISLLVLVAVLACLLPARRATRLDPLTAIRAE